MATNYQRGAAFERRVKADLEARGYLVTRSAGSKSKIDLMAVGHGLILLCQCKRTGWGSPAERTELCRLAEAYDAHAILASAGNPGIAYRQYADKDTHAPWHPEDRA